MKLLFIILANKHAQGGIVGLIAGSISGFIVGSWWVDKSQDEMVRQSAEMLRQLAQVVKITTGG